MLTLDHFADKIGQPFRLRTDEDQKIELKLIEVTPVGQPINDRQQFSIVFQGPRDSVPEQRTYHVEHDVLGGIDLFLVPIFGDDEIVRCEAVFT